MNRSLIIGIIAMAAVVVASNILVQFLMGNWLTWGAFTYPFAFLITDITNRLYGVKQARNVVLVGFCVGVLCSFIGTQIIGEFGPLVTLRIAIGSGFAFLIAQLVDILIFDRLRKNRVVASSSCINPYWLVHRYCFVFHNCFFNIFNSLRTFK